jgi:hypothetical protein
MKDPVVLPENAMGAARASVKSCIATLALLVAVTSPVWADEPAPPEQVANAQSPAPDPNAAVASNLPIRFFANVHLRYDFTRNEDPADLLLDGNQIDGFLTRLRFGLLFRDARSTLSGGLRFSAGEAPNPASPFIRLGDAFRPVTFNLDQFYIDVRPFENKTRVHGIFGKMPLPFWRGDRGVIRNEMTWDDDISPVGAAAQVQIFGKGEGTQQIALENTVGYFIVEWLRDDRFEGLVGDISLSADQLKLTAKRVAVAVAYYHWQNLNSGARAPNFVPGQSAFVLPGRSAVLLRPGFQITNASLDVGSGVHVFRENEFDIFEATGQASVPATVPLLGRSEIVVLAAYNHNVSVDTENKGVSTSVGLVGGNAKMRLKPYSIHGTWRRVEADAALATFADSDIGAGTDVDGFEITGDYRVHQNLSLTASHFNFDGSPNRSIKIKRTFLGMVLDF